MYIPDMKLKNKCALHILINKTGNAIKLFHKHQFRNKKSQRFELLKNATRGHGKMSSEFFMYFCRIKIQITTEFF